MPTSRYKQLPLELDEEDVTTKSSVNISTSNMAQKGLTSLSIILIYFTLSIGLTFYQKWLLKKFEYPLTMILYHLLVKWILSNMVRAVIYLCTCTPQLLLPWDKFVKEVAPTGLAAGIDVGFSNWALKLVNMSLYTMTKSTTIIFILFFAIMHGLEKKTMSLVVIVVMISSGLLMFTYKATEFSLLGFNFLILASFAGGLRWTFAQVVMQKSKLGLSNPIDMVFHVQPWMFLAVLPFAAMFEGFGCLRYLDSLERAKLIPEILKITIGATIAFAMELSEFLVVTYTSSLTLSVAGIFKEIFILGVAILVSGDQISVINGFGLVLCLIGIIAHTVHKLKVLKSGNLHIFKHSKKYRDDLPITPSKQAGENTSAKFVTEQSAPLLEQEDLEMLKHIESDYHSDSDSHRVILDVSQRRTMLR